MLNKKSKKNVNFENLLKVCFTGHRPKGLPWGYNEKMKNVCDLKT